MSDDDSDGGLHPRGTTELIGHHEAEQTLLEAYRGGATPHAWLIGGPRGVGKATLAYRMARFVLAHPDPAAPQVQGAGSLAVAADHPAAQRIAASSHGNLLVLERGLNDKGKLRQDIAVDDVRLTVSFFGSTAWDGGWRIAVVDSVEELNKSGANALLKILEEPPPRVLLLLVSHMPGRILPTIRSRCRRLTLKPLAESEVLQAASIVLGASVDRTELQKAAAAAEGSVARALALLDGPALALRQRVVELLDALPELDRNRLHGLGDALSGYDAEKLAIVIDTINAWLSSRLGAGGDAAGLARVAQAWETINTAAQDAAEYNLERKPLVFSVFGTLAEATRG